MKTEVPSVRRGVWTGSEVWLLALVLFGYGYFDSGHNWNHISRFDAIFSFVERDTTDRFTFQIDHFLPSPRRGRNTGDWARNPAHNEHYYSNKAPGPILLGVPAYTAIYATETLFDLVPESGRITSVNTWLLNVLLTILPAAFGAILFRRVLRSQLGLDAGAATLLTFVLCFGTVIFPYATQLWGHVSAASFAVISLFFLSRRGHAADVWSGVFMGLAVLSDYGSAITLASFGMLLFAERRGASALRFILGGLPALVGYGVYHRTAFGSWLTPATLFNNPRFQLAEGAFGFQPEAMFGLSVSAEHGLFLFMPVLLLVLPALYFSVAGSVHRLQWLALFNVVGFAVMNLMFSGWHGGGCLGPRYLIPSLPFWVMLLAPLAAPLRTRGTLATLGAVVVLAAAGVSGANMTLLALRSPSTTREESRAADRTVFDGPLRAAYRALFAGELAPPALSPIRLGGAWLVDDRIVSAHLGVVVSNTAGGARDHGAISASSWLRLPRAGRVQLLVGWQGTLRLRVAGKEHDLGLHDAFATQEITVALRAGDSKLEVRLEVQPEVQAKVQAKAQLDSSAPSDAMSFQLVALAANGRPLIPRPTKSALVERPAGSNLGRRLGLSIPQSTLLFGAGLACLTLGLVRAVRREEGGRV